MRTMDSHEPRHTFLMNGPFSEDKRRSGIGAPPSFGFAQRGKSIFRVIPLQRGLSLFSVLDSSVEGPVMSITSFVFVEQ